MTHSYDPLISWRTLLSAAKKVDPNAYLAWIDKLVESIIDDNERGSRVLFVNIFLISFLKEEKEKDKTANR